MFVYTVLLMDISHKWSFGHCHRKYTSANYGVRRYAHIMPAAFRKLAKYRSRVRYNDTSRPKCPIH